MVVVFSRKNRGGSANTQPLRNIEEESLRVNQSQRRIPQTRNRRNTDPNNEEEVVFTRENREGSAQQATRTTST